MILDAAEKQAVNWNLTPNIHAMYGYYAQGVGPETAILPAGWQDRLVKIPNQNTDLKIGYCLDPADLAASKLAASREKDKHFVATMLRAQLVTAELLKTRIQLLPLDDTRKAALASWVDAV